MKERKNAMIELIVSFVIIYLLLIGLFWVTSKGL